MISRIIQAEVNVICQSRRLITLTGVWIILDIMRTPNPIIIVTHVPARNMEEIGTHRDHVKLEGAWDPKKKFTLQIILTSVSVAFTLFELMGHVPPGSPL